MTVLQFASYHDIAAHVARKLGSEESAEVLVASGGMASAIQSQLLLLNPSGVVGRHIETLETFARRIVAGANEFPRVATDAERRLAMRMATRNIDDPMMTSRGIAAMIDRSWRDVRDDGITRSDFEARMRGARLRNPQRTLLLIRAWRDYERLIAQMGAIDPADLLRRAAAIIEGGDIAVAPQLLAGFYDMTGAQRGLVDSLRASGKLTAVYVPAGEGDAYRFADPFIASFDDGPRTPITTSPKWSVAQYDTRTIELRETCREVATLLRSGTAPQDIGVVARTLDPQDIALLNRFARDEGFAFSTGDFTPLPAHRLGRALSTLLQLRERGFLRGSVLELVRDGFEPQRGVAIDEIDLATRRAGIAGGTSDELKGLVRNAATATYVALVAELESIAPQASLSATDAADFLKTTLGRFRIETELDLIAAAAIETIAATFRRTSKWNVRFDAATIIDALQNETLGHPRSDDTLPVIFASDVMRFRGRSFRHLFAVRMQDEVFPQRRLDDPLLPDHDRHALALRKIGDGRDEERMLFQLLLDGAEEIHFSFAGGDGFGKTLRPSPLLKSFVIGQMPEHSAELLKNFGGRFIRTAGIEAPLTSAPRRRQLQLLAKSGSRSVFDGYLFADDDDDTLRTKLLETVGSVSPTHLEDFGECPQKFFYKHILGVRDIDDPEHELQLNARDKGKLDHSILERLYRDFTGADYDRAMALLPELDIAIGERIDALVDDSFAELAASVPPFNPTMREIERTATKRILREFVAHDLADLQTSELRPQYFEYRFGKTRHSAVPDHPEPFVVPISGNQTASQPPVTLRVDGTIDRIDAGPRGYRIIDYKGGKATRHKDLGGKIDRGVRLQLAVYAMAVAQFFDADAGAVSGAIKPLVTSDTNARKFAFALAEKEPELRATLDLFVNSILSGIFPAFPADDDSDFNACKYCPVNHSCRTRYDFVEKYLITRHGEPRTLLGGGDVG